VKPAAPEGSPTSDTYNPLQLAYDIYNTYLFKGELPDCLLTLQSKGDRVIAYYRPKAFKHKSEEGKFTDEIAFNPTHLNRTDMLTLATLLHEVIHLWRNMQPKPSRRGYHDKVWAAKMIELGLMPQNCDNPERMTGHKVTHEIIPGGQFDHLAVDMIKGGWRLAWAENSAPQAEVAAAKPKAKKKQTRAKYTCPECEQNAWAKHGASLKCGDCDVEMVAAE
jgi:predicted SprT family Zn-dependent metalloprotease